MLLPSRQMVSEPQQAQQPARLLCEGHAPGAGMLLLSFHGDSLDRAWHTGRAPPWSCGAQGTKLCFHLTAASPKWHHPVPTMLCAHVCPGAEPRSPHPGLLCDPRSSPQQLTSPQALPPARGPAEWCWVRSSQCLLPGCPTWCHLSPASQQHTQLPSASRAPHKAAVFFTWHLNEKGERVEGQEEEEDVLILFSLPVSPHEISNNSGHGVTCSKILTDLRGGSRGQS